MESTLVNKVVNSGLFTIDLEKFYPEGDFVYFDIKDYLFQGLILKEKDFRTALKEIDWAVYKDKNLLIVCSVDAILPLWSFMLVAAYAAPFAKVVFPTPAPPVRQKFNMKLDLKDFQDLAKFMT